MAKLTLVPPSAGAVFITDALTSRDIQLLGDVVLKLRQGALNNIRVEMGSEKFDTLFEMDDIEFTLALPSKWCGERSQNDNPRIAC